MVAWLVAQMVYGAVLGWTWEHYDRYWRHIPKGMRRALTVGACLVVPHLVGVALLLSYLEFRRLRRTRVVAALRDMSRRMKERGAAEKCPKCGEYH